MNNRKILLISANKLTIPYPVYPIGISYIYTYLKSKLPTFQFKIFDFNFDNEDGLHGILKDFNPDYIGVSIRNIDDANSYEKSNFVSSHKELIGLIRKFSNGKIIIGGAGFSIYPEKLFKYLNPDFAIYGEGEKSFYELICCIENNISYNNVDGLIYNEKNKTFFNSKNNYLRELDVCFEKRLLDYYWKNSGMLNIQTKRGCHFNCIYCTYPVIEGRQIRTLSTDKIVESLSELYYNEGINYVFFTDSVFNIENEYNIELAEKIIRSKIDISWGAYFFPKGMNEKLLVLLKKSGLKHIEFGTESLSDTTLKNYRKHFSVEDIIKQSALCNKVGIDFAHFLILCGYGETKDTINETFENSKKIGRTVFFPFVGMRIYPGTELQSIAIKESVIDIDDDLIESKYYIAKNIDINTLKQKAKGTGKQWVFPDEDNTEIMKKLRLLRDKKGPLWEYLIK